jgi:hypothetical protein
MINFSLLQSLIEINDKFIGFKKTFNKYVSTPKFSNFFKKLNLDLGPRKRVILLVTDTTMSCQEVVGHRRENDSSFRI